MITLKEFKAEIIKANPNADIAAMNGIMFSDERGEIFIFDSSDNSDWIPIESAMSKLWDGFQ